MLREAISRLEEDYATRGLELREVASGWRVQVREQFSPWVSRLWEARPPKYSRALLETLALIAYQQPVTRGDIEQVRGVAVSSNIIKTLLDRDWIRIVGHRDVPGKPALYGTTRGFLDYFNLRSLDRLPPLSELRDLSKINEEIGFDAEVVAAAEGASAEAREEEAGEGVAAEVVPLRAVLGQFDPSEDAAARAPVEPSEGASAPADASESEAGAADAGEAADDGAVAGEEGARGPFAAVPGERADDESGVESAAAVPGGESDASSGASASHGDDTEGEGGRSA